MFDYLWWLLPSFLKKSPNEHSYLRRILQSIAENLTAVKTAILKSRLTKFFIPADTTTDYYGTDYPFFLQEHAKDRSLPGGDMNTLLIDPKMRTLLGTKEGLKYYLELFNPGIRVDFIYETAADEMKWILFSKRDLDKEASFNRSVLLNQSERNHGDYEGCRKTRIYSRADPNRSEFLFWVKVYNPITDENDFKVYPEKILSGVDRLKPAHTRGYLVFNYLDPQIAEPRDGQVFIGNAIDIAGTIRQIEPMANA